MARLTLLDDRDLAGLLARFGLELSSWRLLEAGTVNSNYRVETPGGRLFVRVNEGKRDEEVAAEAALLEHLGARGVPTPVPLRARDGAPFARPPGVDKPCSLFPWVPGHHLRRAELRPEHAEGVGEALARLHEAGQGFSGLGAGTYTIAHLFDRLEIVAGATAARPDLAEPQRLLARALRDLERGRFALPSGVIHQDLFMDNVLFDGARLSALLDFEQAVTGAFAYDLAVTLLAWCFSASPEARYVPGLPGALVAGYQRVRPLAPEERIALFPEARLAAVRFAITRITDIELRRDAAPAGKDYRRYLARLHALDALGPDDFAQLCFTRRG